VQRRLPRLVDDAHPSGSKDFDDTKPGKIGPGPGARAMVRRAGRTRRMIGRQLLVVFVAKPLIILWPRGLAASCAVVAIPRDQLPHEDGPRRFAESVAVPWNCRAITAARCRLPGLLEPVAHRVDAGNLIRGQSFVFRPWRGHHGATSFISSF